MSERPKFRYVNEAAGALVLVTLVIAAFLVLRAAWIGRLLSPGESLEVIMPEENEKDLEEIPEDVRDEMTYHFVTHMDKVISNALVRGLDSDVTAAAGEVTSHVEPPPVAH